MPDNGYYFGIGAFETMAVEHGTIEYADLHMARLQKAMEFFQIPFSSEETLQTLEQYLTKNAGELTGHDVLKLAVSDKEQHLSLRPNPYTDENHEKGFQVEFSPIRRNETSPLTYHKTLCYADNLLEKHRILQEGKDEVLFLNSKGEITEGSTTNVFFISGDRLYTPPVSCGLLPGILREVICQKYRVIEQTILPEDLPGFDGAFLTNSLMKAMPADISLMVPGTLNFSISFVKEFLKNF